MVQAAYACLPFKGSLVVDPQGTGTTGSTVIGDGTANSHGYCTNPEGRPSTAGTAAESEQIRVTVAAATCAGTSYKLAADTYEIRLNNNSGSTTAPFLYDTGTSRWVFQSGKGCFFGGGSGPTGTVSLDTTYSVDSAGDGDETVSFPELSTTNGTNDASGLCVGKSGGSGIFAPLRITSI